MPEIPTWVVGSIFLVEMAMERLESESLAIDSFSRSWLIDPPGPLEITGSCSQRSSMDEGPSCFIEMDPRLPASKRFGRNSQNSNFHFPDFKSGAPLVHAEDLFQNGRILGSPLDKAAAGEDGVLSDPACKLTCSARKHAVAGSGGEKNILKRCRNVLHKYLSCLQPFIRQTGTSSKVAENWMVSPETLPRMSIASYSVDDYWRKSCGSESSIDEAVLHCKRSISK